MDKQKVEALCKSGDQNMDNDENNEVAQRFGSLRKCLQGMFIKNGVGVEKDSYAELTDGKERMNTCKFGVKKCTAVWWKSLYPSFFEHDDFKYKVLLLILFLHSIKINFQRNNELFQFFCW